METWQESDLQKRAHLAQDQLRPFREAALTWPIWTTLRHSETSPPRWSHVCRYCDQTIWFKNDLQNRPFTYSEEEIVTLITAHIRQVHSKYVTGEEPWPELPVTETL
jgi:hypothetical protein